MSVRGHHLNYDTPLIFLILLCFNQLFQAAAAKAERQAKAEAIGTIRNGAP